MSDCLLKEDKKTKKSDKDFVTIGDKQIPLKLFSWKETDPIPFEEIDGVKYPKALLDLFPKIDHTLPEIPEVEQWLPRKFMQKGRQNSSNLAILRTLQNGIEGIDQKIIKVLHNHSLLPKEILRGFSTAEQVYKAGTKQNFQALSDHHSPWANLDAWQEKETTEDDYQISYLRICKRMALYIVADVLCTALDLRYPHVEEEFEICEERRKTLEDKRKINAPLSQKRLGEKEATLSPWEYEINPSEILLVRRRSPKDHLILIPERKVNTLAHQAFLSTPHEYDDYMTIFMRERLIIERNERVTKLEFSTVEDRCLYMKKNEIRLAEWNDLIYITIQQQMAEDFQLEIREGDDDEWSSDD